MINIIYIILFELLGGIFMLKEILNLSIIKELKKLPYEVCMFIYFDYNNNPLSFANTETFGNNERVKPADLNLILSNCRKLNCHKVIMVHNHPEIAPKSKISFLNYFLNLFKSSNVCPSQEDIEITSNYKMALEMNGVKVIDHIIVGKSGYYSFLNNGIFDK